MRKQSKKANKKAEAKAAVSARMTLLLIAEAIRNVALSLPAERAK